MAARVLLICAKLLSARASPRLQNDGAKAPIVREPDGKSFGGLPTATGGITRLAYAHAQQAGVDVVPLLAKAGLTEHQVLDRSVRVKVRQQIAFLDLVATAVEDALLGFHLALVPDLRELGLLYYVAASSETFGDAFRRGARYTSISNEALSIQYLEGHDIKMEFDYVGVARHSDRHQMEFFLTSLARLCRQLTGRALAPNRVELIHHRNEDAAEMVAFFGSDVAFGAAADQLTFDAAVGQIPIVSADPYLNELLVANCEEALARSARHRSSFRSQVENAVVPLLPHGKTRADVIAGKLGVSPRTLARRLAAEGATFSEVLEMLRGDLARQYLADQGLSVSQVAWLLGYQESSAFTNAFKRWTGMTPREARATQ